MLRLVSFLVKSSSRSSANIGSLIIDNLGKPLGVVNLTSKFGLLDSATGMLDLIERFPVHEIIEKTAIAQKSDQVLSIQDIILQAPIPVPKRNVMCVGKNYSDHVKEVAAASTTTNVGSGTAAAVVELPKYPQFFSKAANSVIGPGNDIENHSNITNWLDYEAELAVIIGSKCRDVSRERAMEVVFGYTIANDVTARDLQKKHNQWFKGKSLDTTCPMGPCIVLASELSPHLVKDLSIKLWVNGEKRQDSRTSKMIFDIPEIIHQLSAGFTVHTFAVRSCDSFEYSILTVALITILIRSISI
jgi:2-keto-4-pentenoate hydratase/2-oxohepta-3-ene-1,7-dioic acid hydratase in catechol pathway